MSFVKAKLFLFSIAVIWLVMIVLLSPVQMPVTLLAIKLPKLRAYRYGLWIAQDQFINALFMGNPDVTISSKVGYMAREGSETAKKMAVVIDWMFWVTIKQENHCAASIEHDEKHNVFFTKF